ncbi:Peptidyl-prolyl cis-trans isomerase [Macleaya cordata]|uniref:FK506-binding protein n=1 Tax=Macleaya cordata TaxID=56857 RepID=A0A200QB35_MACCD|nr:Peptidyl-prolyl cis-trans isomerase [Macleaya cordata]
MAFWGVHLEPGKPYTHRFDKTRGRLRISQATLGIGCSTEIAGVQCNVGDKSPVLLCAFLPTKNLSCPLDLMFEEEDDVVFSVRGPRSVYLTGFYIGNGRCEDVIENKKVEVGGDRGTSIKRKFDAVIQAGEGKSCVLSELSKDSSVPSTKIKHENGGKSKSKKANEVKPEVAKTDTMDQEPDKPEEKQPSNKNFVAADDVANEDHSEVKKKRKKREAREIDKNANREDEEKKVSTVETEDNKAEVNPLQVRTFSNGLVIEDIEYGKPDAEIASPGSKVSVNYIGKLKINGRIFDSNVGEAPYKFRLGVGDVIKGWDVGINGMRIGDKRRLTIPPSMGYGSKGVDGKVPQSAWLVFEIDLVDVR